MTLFRLTTDGDWAVIGAKWVLKKLASAIGVELGLAACLLLAAPCASAGSREEATAAHGSEDYGRELEILQPEAASGQAWAENDLGVLYLYGNGVRKNYARALALFRQAASKGDAGGIAGIGIVYEHGLSVPRNLAVAATQYRKSAEAGHTYAWSLLENLCSEHPNVAKADCALVPNGTLRASAPMFDEDYARPEVQIKLGFEYGSIFIALGAMISVAFYVSVRNFRNGIAYLFGRVTRTNQPILFWEAVVVWVATYVLLGVIGLGLGIYMVMKSAVGILAQH